MGKTALDWTSKIIKNLNLRLETDPYNDHNIIARWNKLSGVIGDAKYDAVDEFEVKLYKKIQTKNKDGTISTASIKLTQTNMGKGKTAWEYSGIPDDATHIWINVRLKAKSSSSKYSTGDWTTTNINKKSQANYTPNCTVTYKDVNQPDPPSSISTETSEDGLWLMMSVDEPNTNIASVKFFVYRKDSSGNIVEPAETTSDWISFDSNRHAAWRCSITPGQKYFVDGQYQDIYGVTSESSTVQSYESDVDPVPEQVTGVSITAETTSRVKITWTPVQYAAETGGYEIARAPNPDFLGTNMATIDTVDGSPAYASVDSGNIWYFQVRAKNKNGKSGPWSEIKSCTAAKKPNMPTTWSMSSSYKIDERIRLFWTYNSSDNAKPTNSYIHYKINGGTEHIHTEHHTLGEEDTNYTFFWDLTTEATLSDSDRITWWVVCESIGGISDNSIIREIKVYETPTVAVSFAPVVNNFPIDINFIIRPLSQKLVSGYINIYATETYTTMNRKGQDVIVNAGDRIFSKIFTDTSNEFGFLLYPNDLILEDEQTYRVEVSVTLNSGLSADNSDQSKEFTTLFMRSPMMLNCGASYNYDYYTATLMPSCEYIDEDGESTGELVPNTLIDIHRMNSDGSFTTIREGFPNYGNYAIMDPHPLMDTMTYRVVATNMENGQQEYSDIIVENIDLVGLIIQWDESYKDYKMYRDTDEGTDAGKAYSGSMIRILTNLKTSESSNKDVEKISYIGKEDPTTYYGTQKGKIATWSCEIDKTDEATIALIRRLDAYMGDVYVRNQYGIGYWANVEVSYNLDYDNLVMPITFQITKVDSILP